MKKNVIRVLSLLLVAVFLLSGCETALESDTPVQTVTVEPTLAAEPIQTEPTATDPSENAPIETEPTETEPTVYRPYFTEPSQTVSEDGVYTTKDEVALYLHLFSHLPSNYITKKEAQNLGWVSKDGNLWDVAPGKSIGGDRFGNYEGLLPQGHNYYECDIDFPGDYRNAKRIIFSTDGLVYYTEDHYSSFELLYGEE